MKRFWLSWEEPMDESGDPRPNGPWPMPEGIKKWWCSGEGDTIFTLCAVVDAASEDEAFALIKLSWPNCGDRRFCEEKHLDFRPGDRFPWPEVA